MAYLPTPGSQEEENVWANILNEYIRSAIKHVCDIEDMGPGVKITNRPLVYFNEELPINDIGILALGAPSGVDDSNTVVITIKNRAGSTVVTKTFDTANQPPNKDYVSLGTLSINEVVDGDILKITMACNGIANMPAFRIMIR